MSQGNLRVSIHSFLIFLNFQVLLRVCLAIKQWLQDLYGLFFSYHLHFPHLKQIIWFHLALFKEVPFSLKSLFLQELFILFRIWVAFYFYEDMSFLIYQWINLHICHLWFQNLLLIDLLFFHQHSNNMNPKDNFPLIHFLLTLLHFPNLLDHNK
jgi:hypothetical protein